MAGIFGIVSNKDCVSDLFKGTFYLQHRAQDYCGLALHDKDTLRDYTHKGLIKQQFPKQFIKKLSGTSGIGCVADNRQPVSEFNRTGGTITCFDGNLLNCHALKDLLLKRGVTFSGYHTPEHVSDIVIVSKIIAEEIKYVYGIERLIGLIKGDFAIVSLTRDGIYAARGWGRKPLIVGHKDGSWAVASESVSFENLNIKIMGDVKPGEVVFLDRSGVCSIIKFDLSPIKYCAFEWIYNAYPPSVIDQRSVVKVRMKVGQALARRYPVKADLVSPVPNSGRWHAIGYAQESNLPYVEVFTRYDYSDRSYTPTEQITREEEAKIKLLPIKSVIEDKRIVLVDDSIVRGTQTLNQVSRLKDLGAKEVHARIACPPLMSACRYGKTTRNNDVCIARRMSIEDIKSKLELDSLGYAIVEDMELAIGRYKNELCLECWAV